MANRPVFVPRANHLPFVEEVLLAFTWHSGFARSQAQKCIASLHDAAARKGISPVLEISSKSDTKAGVALSAFNLEFEYAGHTFTVETAFQGSKVFESGGPFVDLYDVAGRAAKVDPRLRESGRLTGFDFLGIGFPLEPTTVFYDWLYILALLQQGELVEVVREYAGFTDIAFNPTRSLNCQARSAALYVALHQMGTPSGVLGDPDSFVAYMRGESLPPRVQDKNPAQLALL